MINKRLKRIADFVDDNSNIIDVGCDHAYLAIYLVENKKNIKAIASDINIGPVSIAKTNVGTSNLESFIKVKLGDGLNPLEEDTDTVIISGMGGITISDILKKDSLLLSNIKTLIVSPNNEFYSVRSSLTELGFYIVDEDMIEVKNKTYLIIKAVKGNRKYTTKQLMYGPILLKNKPHQFIDYYENQLIKLNKIVESIPSKENEKLEKEIKEMISILKKN